MQQGVVVRRSNPQRRLHAIIHAHNLYVGSRGRGPQLRLQPARLRMRNRQRPHRQLLPTHAGHLWQHQRHRVRIRTHQSACPQLHPAEIPHHHGRNVEHAAPPQHIQHRLASRARGFAIVAGPLHRVRTLHRVNEGAAMMPRIRILRTGGLNKSPGIILAAHPPNQSDKPRALHLQLARGGDARRRCHIRIHAVSSL